MKAIIEVHREWNEEARGGDVRITMFGRWVRFAVYYGVPPGSHIGFWRTRGGFSGELRGINLRIGRRYVGPCLTMFIHTKRGRAA